VRRGGLEPPQPCGRQNLNSQDSAEKEAVGGADGAAEGHPPDGSTGDAGGPVGDIDRDAVKRALGLARAVEALLAAKLADQARPLHVQLVGLLERLATRD